MHGPLNVKFSVSCMRHVQQVRFPASLSFLLYKHCIFWHDVSLVVGVTCKRWHNRQCYSQDKLMCDGNTTSNRQLCTMSENVAESEND